MERRMWTMMQGDLPDHKPNQKRYKMEITEQRRNPYKSFQRLLKKECGPTFEEIEVAYWEAAERHPGPAFTRPELSKFLGDSPSPRGLANMDSRREGPDGGFYEGRTRKYLKVPAIKWALRRIARLMGVNYE
jgi:hypothetical protein